MEAHRRKAHPEAGGGQEGVNDARRHPCPLCPAKLSSPHHYRRHMQAHQRNQEAGPFVCSHCGKAFEGRRKYLVHLRHHDPNAKKFRCPQCDLGFVQKEFLRRHLLTHSGERPFQCSLCPSTFRQMIHLRQHQRRKHPTSDPKQRCPHCPRAFWTSSELKNHLMYHAPESRTHHCQLCDLSFVEKRHLDRHARRIHGSTRSYHCPTLGCEKAFFEKYELNYHLKHHCE